jgi:AcrR family transcriptional regulator
MGKSILKQLKENERAVRRKLIIDAAKRLFAQKNFHEIGMRDIAREAGISVASLYQYFPGQDDLFVEILTVDIMSIKRQLWDKRTTLGEIATDLVYFMMENEDIFQIMSHFMIKGEKNKNTLKKFNSIQLVIAEMLNNSFIHAGSSEDTGIISQAFFSSLFGQVITYRNYPFKNREEHLAILKNAASITAQAFTMAVRTKEAIMA